VALRQGGTSVVRCIELALTLACIVETPRRVNLKETIPNKRSSHNKYLQTNEVVWIALRLSMFEQSFR
jgi:hypothetical protein